MAELSLRGLSKSFGDTRVVSDVDLDVADGEFVVFVGPSGCGKSTLLRMIAGLESASGGSILIGGRDVTQADAAKRGIAMVFQTYALYPHMTAAANMGFPLEMAGLKAPEIDKRVREAARILHLEALLDRRPRELSGGQRQRVAIGRAIVRQPQVFLFDEPLSNLDAELRAGMRLEIARLHRALGSTMIYVTHDQTEAMTLADRIVVLNAGRIEQVGTPQALYEDPDNLFVAGFIGSPKINRLAGRVEADGTLAAAGIRLPLPPLRRQPAPGEPVSVCLRPEHLVPAAEGLLPFTVEVAEYLGGTTWLYGRTGDGEALTVGTSRKGFRPGERCTVAIPPDAILVFDADGSRIR